MRLKDQLSDFVRSSASQHNPSEPQLPQCPSGDPPFVPLEEVVVRDQLASETPPLAPPVPPRKLTTEDTPDSRLPCNLPKLLAEQRTRIAEDVQDYVRDTVARAMRTQMSSEEHRGRYSQIEDSLARLESMIQALDQRVDELDVSPREARWPCPHFTAVPTPEAECVSINDATRPSQTDIDARDMHIDANDADFKEDTESFCWDDKTENTNDETTEENNPETDTQQQFYVNWHLQESISSADGSDPLPAGWEMRQTHNGKVYFVDHIARTTTWDDPRESRRVNPAASKHTSTGAPSQKSSVLASVWNVAVAPNGTKYYINQDTQETTWDAPEGFGEGTPTQSAPVPASRTTSAPKQYPDSAGTSSAMPQYPITSTAGLTMAASDYTSDISQQETAADVCAAGTPDVAGDARCAQIADDLNRMVTFVSSEEYANIARGLRRDAESIEASQGSDDETHTSPSDAPRDVPPVDHTTGMWGSGADLIDLKSLEASRVTSSVSGTADVETATTINSADMQDSIEDGIEYRPSPAAPERTLSSTSTRSNGSHTSVGPPPHCAAFVDDATLPDFTHVDANVADLVKAWRVRNTGATAWPHTTILVHAEGELSDPNVTFPVQTALPGETVEVTAKLSTCGLPPGHHSGFYRMLDTAGSAFASDLLWCTLDVQPSAPTDEQTSQEQDALRGVTPPRTISSRCGAGDSDFGTIEANSSCDDFIVVRASSAENNEDTTQEHLPVDEEHVSNAAHAVDDSRVSLSASDTVASHMASEPIAPINDDDADVSCAFENGVIVVTNDMLSVDEGSEDNGVADVPQSDADDTLDLDRTTAFSSGAAHASGNVGLVEEWEPTLARSNVSEDMQGSHYYDSMVGSVEESVTENVSGTAYDDVVESAYGEAVCDSASSSVHNDDSAGRSGMDHVPAATEQASGLHGLHFNAAVERLAAASMVAAQEERAVADRARALEFHELYHAEMTQLVTMGFANREDNLRLLRQHRGDLDRVVQSLLDLDSTPPHGIMLPDDNDWGNQRWGRSK